MTSLLVETSTNRCKKVVGKCSENVPYITGRALAYLPVCKDFDCVQFFKEIKNALNYF